MILVLILATILMVTTRFNLNEWQTWIVIMLLAVLTMVAEDNGYEKALRRRP